MQEKILETMVVGFTKALIEECKTLFDDIYDKSYDEIKQYINKGLKRYLDKHKTKYSKIKTLLRGNTPVYLYDIYYPLKLKAKKGTVSTDSISELFKKCNYITIIGDAGSGKSTLVKHLFLNSIKEKVGIPILIELRDLNEEEYEFEEYAKKIISLNQISVNQDILDRFLRKGKFIFFLDGYDELNSNIKKSVVKDINSFIEQYTDNKFILTTRPFSDIEHLPLFHNYKMKDLSLEEGEIKGFIYKQLPEETELAKKIEESIKSNKSTYIKSFLKNPLLLSLYILTFQSNASIPDKKYIFYRRVINALFSEHDSKTKLGFVREKTSKLSQENFELILKTFSFLSFFESKFNFDRDYIYEKLKLIKKKNPSLKYDNNKFIYDLKSAIALWSEEDGIISFSHRSLQEYFAALFVKELNPEDNQRLYQKIIDRFSAIKRLNEIENFISLLEEMDTLNFKKYYYLPLLEELNNQINADSEKEILKNTLLFFAHGIGIQKVHPVDEKGETKEDIRHSIIIKDSVYKSIYIHIPHTREFDRILRRFLNKNRDTVNFHHPDVVKHESNQQKRKWARFSYTIDFDESVPNKLMSLLEGSMVQKRAVIFNEFLVTELKDTKDFIKNSLDVDKDLVDMI
jgi:predicted NACHT family NTPase